MIPSRSTTSATRALLPRLRPRSPRRRADRTLGAASVLLVATTAGLAGQQELAEPDSVPAPPDTAAVHRIDVPVLLAPGGSGSLPGLLDARVPGVLGHPGAGVVGAGARIRARGSSSLALSNTPLVYIDGVRVASRTDGGPFSELSLTSPSTIGQTTSRLEDLDPYEIVSLQVLRGPAAAASHGPGAASGVLLIETRRGGPGGPRVRLSTEQGGAHDVGDYPDNYLNVTAVSETVDPENPVVDPDDPRLDGWTPERNPVTGDLFVRDNPLEDPERSPFGTGRLQAYHLSVSGGTGPDAGISYFGSLAHRDEDGVLPGNGFRRSNGRVNVSIRPVASLELGANVGYVDSETALPYSGGYLLGILENGTLGSPLHEYGEGEEGGRGPCLETALTGGSETTCARRRGYYRARPDVLSRLDNGEGLERVTWGATATWRPADIATGRLLVGEDRLDARLWRLVPPGWSEGLDFPIGLAGQATLGSSSHDRRSVEATLTVAGAMSERIAVSTTVGFQRYDLYREEEACEGSGFPVDAFPSPGDDPASGCDAAGGLTLRSSSFDADQTGGFLRQGFRYHDYLSVHGSVRVDDHSDALDEDGTIWSPAAGVSLLLHRMPGWAWEAADELRLRLAWGRSARVAEAGEEFLLVPVPPGGPTRTAPSHVETTGEIEVGLDASALDRRLSVSATYYRQKTSDAFLGFFTPVQGELENQGLEASLGARPVEGDDVTWDLGLTLATADPVVTDLSSSPPVLHDPGRGFVWEGHAPGVKLGPVVESAERDAEGDIVPGSVTLLPGEVEAVGELRVLGTPRPGDEESLWTTLTLFGDLRVHALFQRAGGHVNFDGTSELGSLSPTTLTRRDAFRQAESTPEEQAALEASGQPLRQTLFVHDATFVKWRELTVSWRLPDGWRDRIFPFSESVEVSAGGRNLLTWTDYPGLDPEVLASGGREGFQGADQFTVPPVRSFHGRLSLTF